MGSRQADVCAGVSRPYSDAIADGAVLPIYCSQGRFEIPME